MPQREALVHLLRDMLAVQTAVKLGLVALPPEEHMEAIRRDAAAAAEVLLSTFEKDILSQEVKSFVLKDVRKELLKKTRATQYIEWALAIFSFAAAAVIGAGQFVFVDQVNLEAIKATYWICLILILLNFVGYLYLRYIDRS